MSIATIFFYGQSISYNESGGDSGRRYSLSCLGVQISIPQIFLPSEVSLEDVGEIINKDERRDKAFRDKVSSKLKLLELERGCDIWFKMLAIPHKKVLHG